MYRVYVLYCSTNLIDNVKTLHIFHSLHHHQPPSTLILLFLPGNLLQNN